MDAHPSPDHGESRPDLSRHAAPPRGTPRERRRALTLSLTRTLVNVTVVLVGYYLLPLDRTFGWGTVTVLALGLLLVTALVGWQVRSILRSPHPALRAVETLALTVPLVLVLFAVAYVVLDRSDPQSFSEPLTRTDALYLVVTVFATVGFGDITAVTEVARALVTLQMVVDLVVLGLVFKVVLDAVERSGARRSLGLPAPRDTHPGERGA